jgi:hypothetical protein
LFNFLFSRGALQHRHLHERCGKAWGTNFAIMDQDHSFQEERPVEPIAEGDNDTTLATRNTDYEKAKAQWDLQEHFQGSSKANASMLMTNVMNAKYTD